ncbi:MAG: hypothetical protein FWE65_01290, partial [Eggerthellaceae bacterium]|nr:hypothetical protein [Eggerthellaceae bacterium]
MEKQDKSSFKSVVPDKKRKPKRKSIRPAVSFLLALMLVLGMVPGGIAAFAEGIRPGSNLVEGEPFPISFDSQGQSLLLELPEGLFVDIDASPDTVQFASPKVLVIEGTPTYIFTADAGEYALQLQDAQGL